MSNKFHYCFNGTVKMMVDHFDFSHTFKTLINDYGVEHNEAFKLTARVYRGGSFTKDFSSAWINRCIKIFKKESLSGLYTDFLSPKSLYSLWHKLYSNICISCSSHAS